MHRRLLAGTGVLLALSFGVSSVARTQELSDDAQRVVDYLLDDWAKQFRSTSISLAMDNLDMEPDDALRLEIGQHFREHTELATNLRYWGANNYIFTNEEKRISKFLIQSRSLAGGSVLAQPGALRITVDYRGSGTVSEDHQLSVFVFDTPNISADSLPIWIGRLADNQKTLTADGIDALTIWVAVAFDETGGYDPLSGPPPSGSPLAIYSTDQTGMPTGVELKANQETEITIAFDDALRMP